MKEGHTFRDDMAIGYQQRHQGYWDDLVDRYEGSRSWGAYYHQRLAEVYRHQIPEGRRILELGCGRGNLLAALRPSVGVGVDFSDRMLQVARARYPHLQFIEADVHQLELDQQFDVIILSDLLNELWDIQQVFERMAQWCGRQTRIVINTYSRVWELPLLMVRQLGLAKPQLRQNWIAGSDVQNLLELTGFQTMRSWTEMIWPLRTPLIDSFMNKCIGKLWPMHALGLTQFILARPQPTPQTTAEPIVSVVVAARNEAGNIRNIVDRVPEMGAGTELIFVEGGSQDDTYQVIEQTIAANPDRNWKLFRQPGKGKGDAVRKGFAEAAGDVLMILDADLTVPPEDLPRFYRALRANKGEFINGVRLVYPMEDEAMRFFNLLGNKFFSWAFTWLLSQSVKDTLCGTKVLSRADYQRIAENRSYFGEFDPFGDFDLLFGAAKQNMKIIDLPVRYRARTYGDTNISRWSHGWLLLKMAGVAARRLKFV